MHIENKATKSTKQGRQIGGPPLKKSILNKEVYIMEVKNKLMAALNQVALSSEEARQILHDMFDRDIAKAKNTSIALSQKIEEIDTAGNDYWFLGWAKGRLDYSIKVAIENIENTDNRIKVFTSIDMLHSAIREARDAMAMVK